MLSVGDREYASIITSVVSSVSRLLEGDGVVVVVRPPPPLLPARGGFLVLWGLGQRVVRALEVSVAIRTTRTVVRRSRRINDILRA